MARRRLRRPKLPTGDFEATIENLSHEGKGIARVEGKTTFIHGALPGEKVRFKYTNRNKRYDEGVCIELIEAPSINRVTPHCPGFEVCGGCSLQHMSAIAQIDFKQSVLKENLTHFARVEPETWLAPLQATDKHYRHKARLSVRYVKAKESAQVGFRERVNPSYVADIDSCAVLEASVGLQIQSLKVLITSLDTRCDIAQIEVAIGQEATILILRNMAPLTSEDEAKLEHYADEHKVYFYLQPKGPDTVSPFYPKPHWQYLSYALPEFNLTMQFSPTDFTQVNPYINQKMVSQAVELLDVQADEAVLDLFCGLGNFSLPIARKAKFVVGVEGSEAMVDRASMNAKHNDITNAHFYALDLTSPFDGEVWARQQFDKLLIDPPRSGAKEIVENIEKIAPKRIVYVSCSTASLARDAGILVHEKGYRLTQCGVMDMFPHTSHVESIAVFDKT